MSNKMKTIWAAALIATAIGASARANEVIDGDFSASPSATPAWSHPNYTYQANGVPETTEYVVTNSTAFNPNFTTNVTGNNTSQFLAVNGATTAGQVAWEETLAVVPGATYLFSVDATSLYPTSPASLNVTFAPPGGSQDLANLTSSVPGWTTYGLTYTAGQNTTVTISIADSDLDASGNDFGLDNISFTQAGAVSVPLPASTYGGAALFGGLIIARQIGRRR